MIRYVGGPKDGMYAKEGYAYRMDNGSHWNPEVGAYEVSKGIRGYKKHDGIRGTFYVHATVFDAWLGQET